MQKDLTRRLRDATDARIEIEDALAVPPAAEETVIGLNAHATRNVWRWALVSGLVSLVVAFLTGITVWNLRTPPPISRLTITLPAGQRLAALDQPAIAISPDGKNLVYVAAQDRGVGTGVSPVSQGQAGRPVATETQQLFPAPNRQPRSKAHCRDGERGKSVLFARQPMDRLLRRREAQESFRKWQSSGDAGQRARSWRRQLEQPGNLTTSLEIPSPG